MLTFLRFPLFLLLLCAPVDANHRGLWSSSATTPATRRFLPHVPNGLLRSVAALNKRPVTTASTKTLAPDGSSVRSVRQYYPAVQEVSTTTVEKKKKKKKKKRSEVWMEKIMNTRPSNEQLHQHLSRVGFFYGMTPQVVDQSTTDRTTANYQRPHREKQLALRDTMKETLEELRSMRQELEALRRDMRAIRRHMGGDLGDEEEDDESKRDRSGGAMMARRKRLLEFEKIGVDVEKWAYDLLFRQDGEADGWTEIKCNKVVEGVFNRDEKTRAYMKWMKDSRGVHAVQQDDREYPCMKAYSTIDAPLEEVCSYLSQEKRLGEYNGLVARHCDLEEVTPSSKICLAETFQILFVKPRTFVTFCNHRWLRDGTQVVINQACEHKQKQANAFALRGATYIGRDPDDPEKTRISFLTHASPGPDVPHWACKTGISALAPIEPFKLFHKINEGVKRARPELQPDLNDTEMVGMPGRLTRPAGLAQLGFACYWPNGGGIKEGLSTELHNQEGVPSSEGALNVQDERDNF